MISGGHEKRNQGDIGKILDALGEDFERFRSRLASYPCSYARFDIRMFSPVGRLDTCEYQEKNR